MAKIKISKNNTEVKTAHLTSDIIDRLESDSKALQVSQSEIQRFALCKLFNLSTDNFPNKIIKKYSIIAE